MKNHQSNIAEMFFRTAGKYPTRSAIVLHDTKSSKSYSYREVVNCVLAAVRILNNSQFQSTELIAFQFSNPLWDMIYFIAASTVGLGVYVPTRQLEVERKILKILKIKQIISDRPVNSYGIKSVVVPNIETFAETSPSADPLATCSAEPTRPWLVRSSSGTTGSPKIFLVNHEDGIFKRQRYFDAVPSQPGCFISLTPLRFASSRQRNFFSLCFGRTLHLLKNEQPLSDIVKLINDYDINNIFCVPMHLKMLCDLSMSKRHANAGLLLPNQPNLESSTSLVSEDLQSGIRSLVTPRFINSYSTGETGYISSTYDFENYSKTYSDVGSIVAGVDLKVFDEQGHEMESDEIGLIGVRFKDRKMRIDYVNESGIRTSALRDGWFFPGDLGFFSKQNRLFFVGRNDDLIIFNGINIFPAEIERSARIGTLIKDACAFSIPSKLHHQIPCIAVIPSDGFNQAIFMDQLKSRLAHKAPKICIQIQQFPKNAIGKVLRREFSRIMVEKLASHKAHADEKVAQSKN